MKKANDTFLTNPNLVKQLSLLKFDDIISEATISPSFKHPQTKTETNTAKKKEDVIFLKKYDNENQKIRKGLYDKIQFFPPSDNYYKNFPIKPGVSFIKQLFDFDNSEKAVKNLRVNIPETYFNNTEIIYVYNDPESNDELKIIKNKRDLQIFNLFTDIEKKFYSRVFSNKDNILPFMVIRGPMGSPDSHETYSAVERYETALDTSTNDNSHGVIQRYIRSKGKNRNLLNENEAKRNQTLKSWTKPSIIRIEYKTRYNNSKNPNIAYYIINKKQLEPELEKDKEKLSKDKEKYTTLCTVNTQLTDTYEVFTMSGDSLRPYEFYCNQIVSYIHKYFKFLLKTIVCDFTKDERGKIYFLGLKAFTPLYETEQIQKSIFSNQNYIKDEKNINKIYKTLTCKMCLLSYPKNKITKIVTYKLMLKLKENLDKRKLPILDHLNSFNISESETCKVCNLCYKLLISDEELSELQRTIALSMNISSISNERDTRFENKLFTKKPKIITEIGKSTEANKVKIKISNLTQFRILFYFIRIYNLDVAQIDLKPNTDYKLYIRVFDQKFSFPILEDNKKIISKEEIELNFAKMFYFFTSDTTAMKSILKNEVVDFRIVKNDNYDEPFAQCQTQCFFFFENDTVTFRIKNIFNFFSDDIGHFKMQIYIGLTNDDIVDTSKLTLYNYKLLNTIYLTEAFYFSYHPLPDDWHELFVPEGSDFKEVQNTFGNEIDKVINNIVEDLGFENYKEDIKEEDIYDPYDQLVQMQKKKTTITKIKSIAMIQDKEPWEKKVELKKERPLTSNLIRNFKINQNDQKLIKSDLSSDSDSFRSYEKSEKGNNGDFLTLTKINSMNTDNLLKINTEMNKRLDDIINN